MTSPLDYAKLEMSAAKQQVDSRIQLARASVEIASAKQDLLRKQIENGKLIAQEKRVRQAHRDYLHAQQQALGEWRDAVREQEIVEDKQVDLGRMMAFDSPQAIRDGWVAFKFFLMRCHTSIMTRVIRADFYQRLETLRIENRKPTDPEDMMAFAEALDAISENIQLQATITSETAKEAKLRASELRSMDWKLFEV